MSPWLHTLPLPLSLTWQTDLRHLDTFCRNDKFPRLQRNHIPWYIISATVPCNPEHVNSLRRSDISSPTHQLIRSLHVGTPFPWTESNAGKWVPANPSCRYDSCPTYEAVQVINYRNSQAIGVGIGVVGIKTSMTQYTFTSQFESDLQ